MTIHPSRLQGHRRLPTLKALAVLCAFGAAVANTGAMAADGAEGYQTLNEIIRSLAPIEYLPEHGGPQPSIDLDIRFALDSAILTLGAKRQLDTLAAAMRWSGLDGARFLLAGHTDATATRAYNLALSERRAAAVRRYLVTRHGIDPARLDVLGWGEERLKHPNNPASAINRRVEVVRLSPIGEAGSVDRGGESVATSVPVPAGAATMGNRANIEW